MFSRVRTKTTSDICTVTRPRKGFARRYGYGDRFQLLGVDTGVDLTPGREVLVVFRS